MTLFPVHAGSLEFDSIRVILLGASARKLHDFSLSMTHNCPKRSHNKSVPPPSLRSSTRFIKSFPPSFPSRLRCVVVIASYDYDTPETRRKGGGKGLYEARGGTERRRRDTFVMTPFRAIVRHR